MSDKKNMKAEMKEAVQTMSLQMSDKSTIPLKESTSHNANNPFVGKSLKDIQIATVLVSELCQYSIDFLNGIKKIFKE